MSQPTPESPGDRTDVDPLLEFDSESAGAATETVIAATENVVAAIRHDRPLPAPPSPEVEVLRARIKLAELSLKRAEGGQRQSTAEVAALRTDLVILVSTVKDLQKHLHRKVEPVVPRQQSPRIRPHRSRAGVSIAALVLVSAATMAWPFTRGDRFGEEPPVAEPPTASAELEDIPRLPPPAVVQPVARQTAEPVASQTLAAPPPVRRLAVPELPSKVATRPAYVGGLSIDTDPAGATVLLNRKPVGRTPLRLKDLRAGSHLVWLELDGYRRWTKVVVVPADTTTRISTELETANTNTKRR